MPGNFAASSQYPLNVVGPKGQNAFVGMQSVYFTGPTGLVGTSYGIPGVSVSRSASVGTGVYDITFPSARDVRIIPGLQCPSGHAYHANVARLSPVSGTAQLHLTRQMGTGVTLPLQPQNPVTGAVVNLMFFVSPVTAY